MKAKEWLVQQGHLTAVTRGRISAENHKRLAESGMTFSDWSGDRVAVMVTETVTSDGATEESVSAYRIDGYTRTGEIADIAPYRFNHDTHAAYELNADGTRGSVRSLREICFTDGVSLVQCTCNAPKVVARDGSGYVRVIIAEHKRKPHAGNIWDNPRK